jgi:hypothetical protein
MRMRDVGARDAGKRLAALERRGCSPTTIRKAKAALAVMLACAVQDGDLAFNPASGVRYVPTEAAKRKSSIAATRRTAANAGADS